MDKQWARLFKILADDSVSELEANGIDEFFIKQKGKRKKVNVSYPDVASYVEGIETSLVPNVDVIFDWNPDAFLFEGDTNINVDGIIVQARVHIVLPPSAKVPQITIAKKSSALATLDDIAKRGSMSKEMLEFLKMIVKNKLSLIVSGGTGAGKTTMLEAMTKFIDKESRVGIAEDIPELNLTDHPNKTFLRSTPLRPGIDPKNVASLDWCVQQFQRMRVDSLIIGETRGKEFKSFLVAANSGMDGSMTTLHATTSKSTLEKASLLASIDSGGQPMRSINLSIATAVDIIVQLGILSDGRHKVLEITEVTSVISPNDDAAISIEVLYRYDPQNDVFIKEGTMTDPLREKLKLRGANIDAFMAKPIGSVMPPEGEDFSNRADQRLQQTPGGNPFKQRGSRVIN